MASETHDQLLARKERLVREQQGMADAARAERVRTSPQFAAPTITEGETVPVRTLVGSQGLPRDARTVRRLLEALALGYGVPSPTQEVPAAWVPLVHCLHEARSRGSSWRAALVEVGLEPPVDLAPLVAERERALRALWDKLPGLGGAALRLHNGVGQARLREALRQTLG